MSLWTKALGRSTLTVLRGLKRNKYLQCHCALPGRSTLTVLRGLKLVSGAHDIDVIVKSQHFDGAAWIETRFIPIDSSCWASRSTLTVLRGLKPSSFPLTFPLPSGRSTLTVLRGLKRCV